MDKPDYSGLPDYDQDWARSVYGNVREAVPSNCPEPKGKSVCTTMYKDANLYHDVTTGRAVTGVLHFINKTPIDWTRYQPTRPKFIGRRVFKNFDLAELARFIDWGPFFQTWDLAGPFPAILKDEIVGAEAQRVFSDGKRMLQRLIEGRWLTANAVVGLYPANTVNDDDIAFYTDESRTDVAMTWFGLRQQTEKQEIDGVMRPSRCLSDFVAPQGSGVAEQGEGAQQRQGHVAWVHVVSGIWK